MTNLGRSEACSGEPVHPGWPRERNLPHVEMLIINFPFGKFNFSAKIQSNLLIGLPGAYMKTAKQIRNSFFQYFENQGHRIIESAPIIPQGDPTLLFTNAGMNQFKDIFLGTGTYDCSRVADTQKCLRVSGKHNDLEEVGQDTYHHTFFEMLGNWSFGDYFKEDAIRWAWDYLANVCQLPTEKLWTTVFGGDDQMDLGPDLEAENLWLEISDLPAERMLRCSRKDNFWEMGETGPCGPCSEIHFDQGPEMCELGHIPGHVCRVNGDCSRYIEIWNLVFIQFNRLQGGSLKDLPNKHVDTGMGLERLVAVMQNYQSNYDTDLFTPIIKILEDISGHQYGNHKKVDVAFRVIADHVRALAVAIADGALPGKVGRGYVLRRLLRRACRFSRQTLELQEPILSRLMPAVMDIFSETFPEIKRREEVICQTFDFEEELFAKTIHRGIERFTLVTDNLQKEKKDIIDGHIAYRLYHQDGFPRDLIDLMAREKGLQVDNETWQKAESEHRESSKGEKEEQIVDPNRVEGLPATLFHGYWEQRVKDGDKGAPDVAAAIDGQGKILKIIDTTVAEANPKLSLAMVTDTTPFYAESGGQVGDQGHITGDNFDFKVNNTIKTGDVYLHLGFLAKGNRTELPAQVSMKVDMERRLAIMANHTATHLMHWAMKKVLGENADQHGSVVDENRLRFDVSHRNSITDEELEKIELLVNQSIRENIGLNIAVMEKQEALKSGVTALFGEKYGQWVRVVDVGGFSRELCGGTHVRATGEIGFFAIVSESACEAGVRRVEAVTGPKAVQHALNWRKILKQSATRLGVPLEMVPERIEKIQAQIKEMKKKRTQTSQKDIKTLPNTLLAQASLVDSSIRVIIQNLGDYKPNQLGEIADNLRSRDNTAGLLAAVDQEKGKIFLLGFRSKGLEKIHAGQMVKKISQLLKGGGGGRPDFAKGGGKDIPGLPGALKEAEKIIKEMLKEP